LTDLILNQILKSLLWVIFLRFLSAWILFLKP